MTNDLAKTRARYRREGLAPSQADPDPVAQFRRWQAEWAATNPYDAAAAVLATVAPDGQPAARLVDVVRVDHGFVFLTRYDSRKGLELTVNPRAALCFGWLEADRQVRVEGDTERLDEVAADGFFGRLPRPVQLLARASDQSATVDGPEVVRDRIAALERRYAGQEVPRGRDWGGYRLLPRRMEFWQGRVDGVPDRLRYQRRDDGSWDLERLTP